jgi:hypothetical protein
MSRVHSWTSHLPRQAAGQRTGPTAPSPRHVAVQPAAGWNHQAAAALRHQNMWCPISRSLSNGRNCTYCRECCCTIRVHPAEGYADEWQKVRRGCLNTAPWLQHDGHAGAACRRHTSAAQRAAACRRRRCCCKSPPASRRARSGQGGCCRSCRPPACRLVLKLQQLYLLRVAELSVQLDVIVCNAPKVLMLCCIFRDGAAR